VNREKLKNLTPEESRLLAIKLLFALLVIGYLMLIVWSGLAIVLGAVSIYLIFVLNIIRKMFP
jgi:hypothetical protein